MLVVARGECAGTLQVDIVGCGILTAGTVVGHIESVVGIVRVHTLITSHTIADAELPVAEPVGIDVLGDTITERCRGEETVLVVLTETA